MDALTGYGSSGDESDKEETSTEEKEPSKAKGTNERRLQFCKEKMSDFPGFLSGEELYHLNPKKMSMAVVAAAPDVQPNETMDQRRHLDPIGTKEVSQGFLTLSLACRFSR